MNKRLVRRTICLIIAVFMSISLMACGTSKSKEETNTSTPSTNATSDAQTTEKKPAVELTLSTSNTWANDSFKSNMKRFEEATGNTIRLDLYPDDQFQNLIKTKLATSDVPDIFAWNMGDDYVPYTNLEPLDGEWKAIMKKPLLIRATRKSDNEVVTVPFSGIPYYAVVYNKEAFQKAGIKVPLMNYNEVLAACEALKKAGITPFYVQDKDAWTGEMIPAIGGTYIGAKYPSIFTRLTKNEVKPSDVPEFVDLAERTLALMDKGYFNSDHLSVAYPDGFGPVVEGKAAMVAMGTFIYGDIKAKFPDKIDNLGAMPISLGDDYISAVAGFNSGSFSVPSAGKNKDVAKDFINFMLKPEQLMTFSESVWSGSSPYEGVEMKSSPWHKEIDGYIKQYNMPLTQAYIAEYSSNFDFGWTAEAWQPMFAGQEIKKSLDNWYKKYGEINKTKRIPGFEKLLK